MKNRAIALIIGIMTAAGASVYNYTGTEVILPNGEEITTHNLVKDAKKVYSDRSIKDSLTIYIHHTAGSKSQSLENIAEYHVKNRKWPGIAYHVAVNEKGDVYFLNDIEKRTYHNSADNTKGIGIVAVGNYENYEPSDDMVESIKEITDAMCLTMKIKAIKGHKDSKPTACPGKYLYNKLKVEGVLMQR